MEWFKRNEREAPSAFKAATGWLPLLMAGAATALVVGYIATGKS